MAKTIIINENTLQKEVLTEGILLDKLPSDISDVLRSRETPFGNNPCFPDSYNSNYETLVTTQRFKETIDGLKNIGTIDDFPDTELSSMQNKLISKCQKIEEPIKSELEKICYNTVVKLFQIPEDYVQLQIELVDNIDNSNLFTRVKSEGGMENYTSTDEISSFTIQLYKRRIISALIVGGALRLSSKAGLYMGEIYDANFKLPDLYNKITKINDYLLFSKENLGIDDKHKCMMGLSDIKLGNAETLTAIRAEGMIFPVLLMETIRGFLELFASHGLPKDDGLCSKIMNVTDCLEYEPWDMRMGPAMWDSFMKVCGNPEPQLIPYIFMRFCQLSAERFLKVTKEMLAETDKAQKLFSKTVATAQYKAEYGDFEKTMQLRKEKQDMITDEYYRN